MSESKYVSVIIKFHMWGSRGLAPHNLNPHIGLNKEMQAPSLFSEEAVRSVAPERQICTSSGKQTP
jgi:hypothetical protein